MVERTKVKILAIQGSGRKANTYFAVKEALKAAEEFDFVEKTEFISLASLKLTPCKGCMKCFAWAAPADEPWRCRLDNDDANILMQKICEYDGLILGFPVYNLGVNALTRCFIEKISSFRGKQWGVGADLVRLRVRGYICVGGAIDGSLEMAMNDMVKTELWGEPVGIPLPMLEDTNPLRGDMGALVTTGMAKNVYTKDAYTMEQSRQSPPVIQERQLKTIRAVGRAVAIGSYLSLAADKLLDELDIKLPQMPKWKKYNIKPKPGSMMEKRIKEGLTELVDSSTPDYEELSDKEGKNE